MHFPPGSKQAQILEEVSPMGDEMVFSKTCGSVFNGTNLHYVLTNMGISSVVVVGVVTSGCVEAAARDAKDLGYGVVLVSDACATWSAEIEAASIRVLQVAYAKIKTTKEMLYLLKG
jgi:nicotinamidase-related amidase